MKRRTLLQLGLTAALLIAPAVLLAQDGITFTFKPGSLINTADVGMEFGSFNAHAGFDLAWMSVGFNDEFTSVSVYEDGMNTQRYVYQDKVEINASAMIFVPHLGVKYSLGRRAAGQVSPFIRGVFFKSFASVNIEGKQKNVQYEWDDYQPGDPPDDSDVWEDEYADEDASSIAEDALDFWGLQVAFGAEYYFNERFSLGGEFGIRMLMNGVEDSGSEEESYGSPGDWSSSYRDEWKTELDAAFRLTYAVLNLNFYL